MHNKGSAKSRLNSYVEENRKQIENLRVKNAIQKRPQSALPDKQRVKMKTVFGDVEGQAVEAWTKLSSEKDKAALQQTIDEVYASKVGSRAASPAKSVTPQLRVSPKPASRKGSAASKPASPAAVRRESATRRTMPTLRSKVQGQSEDVYSVHRWMKKAGNQENENVRRLMSALRRAPMQKLKLEGPHYHVTDYSSMFAPAPNQTFYDFQIHPEWHQPWHKQYENRVKV